MGILQGAQMDYAVIFLLLAVGLFFLLTELFIPSAGMLGIAGTVALGFSLFFAFRMSIAMGIVDVGLIVVLLPLELIFGVKFFPHTPLGKRMLLKPKEQTTAADRASEKDLSDLAGQEGVTVTYLRPAGVADIGGRRVDVVAEGTFIDVNQPVKVARIDGNRVVVRERKL
jgi:membrane-bound serine protease (ClpP class)